MNEEQFDKLMKAIKEVSWVIVIGTLGNAVILAMIGLMIVDLLK